MRVRKLEPCQAGGAAAACEMRSFDVATDGLTSVGRMPSLKFLCLNLLAGHYSMVENL